MLATSIVVICSPVGGILGLLFPTFFISPSDAEEDHKDEARRHVFQTIFWQAILISPILFVILGFFKEKPPTPPSELVV